MQMDNGISVSNRNCSKVSEYSGEVCRDELMSLQMCFSGVTSPLNIPSSIDQQIGENDAMSLVNGLSFLNPSQQCSEAIMPFLCLYIFSLCDSSNTLHTILRQDCLDIRDDVCAREWSQAVAFLGGGVLPVCEDLPDVIENCTGKNYNTVCIQPSNCHSYSMELSQPMGGGLEVIYFGYRYTKPHQNNYLFIIRNFFKN